MNETDKAEHGPGAYENWKRSLSGGPADAYEVPLYADAYVVGEPASGFGPYQLLNTVSVIAPGHGYGVARPVVVLRVTDHLNESILSDPAFFEEAARKTDERRYTALWLPDEVAALVSLCLGMRLKAGNVPSRLFLPGKDPRGVPRNFADARVPMLIPNPGGPIVPNASARHPLDAPEMQHFQTLPRLKACDAVALVRAARLYQDGLWLAESHSELSWIMLVSALETASASHAAKGSERQVLNGYVGEIKAAHLEHADEIAKLVEKAYRLTAEFVDFVERFLPEQPQPRPPEECQLPWDKGSMRKAMTTIYGYRSRALHEAKPFPKPMCDSPSVSGEVPYEVPLGGKTTLGMSQWTKDDLPMHLHTFEYIARGALLKWWQSMVPSEEQAATA